MVAVLVVRGLLGLLLEFLEFLDLVLILVLGSLVVDRLADYLHRLCMMVGFLGFLGLS
jgi:hypothetical protein